MIARCGAALHADSGRDCAAESEHEDVSHSPQQARCGADEGDLPARAGADHGRATGENSWGVSFLRMLDMSNDSHLFRTREQLEVEGWRLEGNRFVWEGSRESGVGSGVYLPLYEAKMLHQFDHRWATYEGLETRDLTPAEKDDPNYLVLPRYWVDRQQVDERLGDYGAGWLIGFRDICRSTDERTADLHSCRGWESGIALFSSCRTRMRKDCLCLCRQIELFRG